VSLRRQNVLKLAASISLLTVIYAQRADALSDAPKPATGNALAQFYLPHLNNAANYGPIVQLAPTEIKHIPHPVFIDKALSEKLNTPEGLTVSHINVDSDTPFVLKGSTRSELTQAYLNTPLTTEQVQEMAGKLNNACLNADYACSVTVNLTEDVSDSLTVFVKALELNELKIEEGRYFKERAIRPFLSLEANQPIHLSRLQRQVRQLQSNPDLVLEVEMQPVEFSHKSNVVIKVAEDKHPLHVSAFFNNLNLNVYGNYFYGGGVVHNNIFGFGDTLTLTGVGASRNGYGFFGRYETPINAHGTRLFTEGGIVNAAPKTPLFSSFDYNVARAYLWSLGVKQILWDKNQTRLAADATFDIKQMRTQESQQDLEREQFRQLRFGLQLDRADKTGTTTLREEVGWGLDVLGATLSGSEKASTDRAGGQYVRFTTTASRIQQLPWGTEGVFLGSFQYSPDHLPFMEQYFGGGTFTGRGYREGLIGADTLAFASAQWNIPAFFIPKSWHVPKTSISLRDNIKVILFADYLWAHLNSLTPGADSSEQLLSVGAGLRAKLSKYCNARLDVAFPVLREFDFSQKPRLHFGIESAIF
jgi:hemolysin activation/secretion protein